MEQTEQSIMFDSSDVYYKSPFGAVPKGDSFTLRTLVHRSCAAKRVFVKLEYDLTGEQRELNMIWCGMEKSYDIYSADVCIDEYTGLVWYSFCADDMICNNDGKRWRVTVYDGANDIPDWYGKGITYQIFPDRFARPEDEKLPDTPWGGARRLHTDWNEPMDWQPEPNGDVKNLDFYGGSIKGILGKLDYLQSLNVRTIYLNPIFLSASNHRYDTSDYLTIDPWFGTEEDFKELLEESNKRGMRVMLDGVFNHTGSDSVYFNKNRRFPGEGAYSSKTSRYYDWYHFTDWPDAYDCWWGVKILPQVNENCADYRSFVLDGVIEKWTRMGVSGWRLDVADELPDDFIADINVKAKSVNAQAVVVGEVWEDPTNKVAYGQKRRYFYEQILDGATNYPFRNATLAFLNNRDGKAFQNSMTELFENTPPRVLRTMMNVIGTHDTPRIINMLGYSGSAGELSRDERANYKLTPDERTRGIRLVKLAAFIQMTFPGSPCIYYGDEVGLEGFEDPFNRRGYPWGNENGELLSWYRSLTEIRAHHPEIGEALPQFFRCGNGVVAYTLENGKEILACFIHTGEKESLIEIASETDAKSLITGGIYPSTDGQICVPISGDACDIFRLENRDQTAGD